MKKNVLVFIFFLLAAGFCFGAEIDVPVPLMDIAVSGQVFPEDLAVWLVEKNGVTPQYAIALGNVGLLNKTDELGRYFSIIVPEVYSLIYSYVAEEEGTSSVRLRMTTAGLTEDGGKTFPIAVHFVSEYDDFQDIDWSHELIKIRGTADSELFKNFRIRMDNRAGVPIKNGRYSGSADINMVTQ